MPYCDRGRRRHARPWPDGRVLRRYHTTATSINCVARLSAGADNLREPPCVILPAITRLPGDSAPSRPAIAEEASAFLRRARAGVRRDAGEPPGPADELARFGLTDREREVLLLVAQGRSNPEIAAALSISPKTASVHVSNILAKLGVAGRVEAAALVGRLGVTRSARSSEELQAMAL